MRWKWITIGTAVLVSALTLAGYVALKTYDFDKLRPAITKTVKEATGRTLTLGRMNLRIGLIPVLIVEEMSLDNPAWTSRRDLFRVRRMEVELALLPLFRKDVQVKRLLLIEPDLQIETDHSGASNLVLPVVAKEGKSSFWERVGLPSVSFEKVVVERARLSFKDQGSSTPLLVRVHNLEAMAGSFQSPVTMNLRGSSRGVPFSVQAVTGSLEELVRRDKPWPLSAAIQALGAQLKMKGSVQDVIRWAGFAVAFEGKGKSTKEVSKLMGLSGLPDIGPFRVAGTASDRAAKVYRFSDLTMRSRGGEVSGTLEIDLAGKRPSLRGSFSSQKLNLTPLLPPKEVKSKKRKEEKVFSEKTFRPALPTKIDADLKVQGKQLITPYGSLQDFLIDFSLREGSMSLKALRGAIDGGLIEGEVECRSGMNHLLLEKNVLAVP